MQKIKKAIFPVGGLGTRFLPATKSLPKEMLPVHSKPLIQHAFEEAKAAGIEQFIFVTGRNKNAISNHFDHSYELQSILTDAEKRHELSLVKNWMPDPGQVAFVRQQLPLGLGHAVWCARHFIQNEPVAVLLADELFISETPVLKQMMECYETYGSNVIGIAEVPLEHTQRYGIVKTESSKEKSVRIHHMVEKPLPSEAPSNLSIVGRYILLPEIFPFLEEEHKKYDNISKKEIQLTNAMAAMLPYAPFYGVKFEGKRYDCGYPLGFLEANIAMALADPESSDKTKEMLQKIISS